VENVSVKRVLPDTLIIGVSEKTPAFWTLSGGILHYADVRGRLIAPLIPGSFAPLPTLEVELGAEDIVAILPDLVKSLQESRVPLDMNSISMMRLSSARGVELYVNDAHLKIFIDLEEWASNLRRLGRTLSDLERRTELRGVQAIKAQGVNVWVERRTAFTSSQKGVGVRRRCNGQG
jgi:cell division protein FtsQ